MPEGTSNHSFVTTMFKANYRAAFFLYGIAETKIVIMWCGPYSADEELPFPYTGVDISIFDAWNYAVTAVKQTCCSVSHSGCPSTTVRQKLYFERLKSAHLLKEIHEEIDCQSRRLGARNLARASQRLLRMHPCHQVENSACAGIRTHHADNSVHRSDAPANESNYN